MLIIGLEMSLLLLNDVNTPLTNAVNLGIHLLVALHQLRVETYSVP